ncbi:hypothetical protein P1N98_09000, partial [Tsukamurella tyrosinosolvens]|uniref:hypothetical protein n=1 Tax=Tsukamurella tyrosinosolvens TaxID=57704 RepID=UPI002481681C
LASAENGLADGAGFGVSVQEAPGAAAAVPAVDPSGPVREAIAIAVTSIFFERNVMGTLSRR